MQFYCLSKYVRSIPIGFLLFLAHTPLGADPGPGDIFREYLWKGPFVNASNWQRVTDPQAANQGAHTFLPNPVNKISIEDLDQAVRAEVYLELWGGHAGTSDKRLRLNGHDWIPIPEASEIPGSAGTLPPECYQQFRYPSVPIPLDQLRPGENTFEFTSGRQICFNFGWGQWGVYGVTFRIYYTAEKPHPQGRVISPIASADLSDTWTLSADVSSATSSVEHVDFIGHYQDFDYEGNGRTRQWHYNYRYGNITRHLGTTSEAPFDISMDAAWVPDQSAPIQIMARIRDTAGINYMTPAVEGFHLQRRDRRVKLYLPHQVPGSWQTRAGRRHRSDVFVPYDLQYATAALMVLTTWSGSHANAIGLNDSTLVPRVGKDHNYSYDVVPVPLDYLRQGTNTFFTFSSTEHHGIEVLWPGIVLQVEYEGLEETAAIPHQDLEIYSDAAAHNWAVDHVGDGTELDTAVHDSVFSGTRAIELRVAQGQWRLDLIPDLPTDTTPATAPCALPLDVKM